MKNMTENNTFFKEKVEQAFAYLTINCSFIPNLGLFHGRMGFVILFAHYAKATNSSLYEEFAVKLLDEVFRELTKESSISLESGLCGIGWGVEYLVQNGFMEGNTDEILKDIDNRIMEYDPKRMKDLSLRRGLGGVITYVIARLSSSRKKEKLPFDKKYLIDLRETVIQRDFSIEYEVPQSLIFRFIKLIDHNTIDRISLQELFSSLVSNKEKSTSFNESLFITGLEYCWASIDKFSDIKPILLDKNYSNNKHNIYIVSNETRSSRYGVGTYVCQLLEALENTEWIVTVIVLGSRKTTTCIVDEIENIRYIYIGEILNIKNNINGQLHWNLYTQNALVILKLIIPQTNNPVFMLNHLHFADLANALKQYYIGAKIVSTVHYMDWSFSLWGNRDKLKEILANPNDVGNKLLCEGFEEGKRFLHACDKVMAIAKHSYDVLLEECKVPANKLALVPHGIKDKKINQTRNKLREKYGFKENETLIIFAGRLDHIKGVDLLADAFYHLCLKYDHIRLLIAGEGSYNLIQEKILYHSTRVSLLGFTNKKELYELFSISDIGVVPSLYEDFGYVAIEMMMNKLPLIVGNKSGLAEIVEDGVTGIIVSFEQEVKHTRKNTVALQNCIEKLIQSPNLSKHMGIQGRKRFLSYYNLTHFKKRFLYNIEHK